MSLLLGETDLSQTDLRKEGEKFKKRFNATGIVETAIIVQRLYFFALHSARGLVAWRCLHLLLMRGYSLGHVYNFPDCRR